MSYTRTTWIARVGTALNRFLKTNETSTEVELTNDPTGVTTAGTPFTVDNMNKIEQGIYDAHVGLDNNGLIDNTRINQDVRTTANPTFANSTIAGHNIDSELDTLNGRVNQGVKTTDSPTFASLHIDTAYLSKFANLSAGAIAPPYNSVFNIGSCNNTSYTSIASFSLASTVAKSVDLSSNGISGCRLTFLKLGAAGSVATQVRILVDGVQKYESEMSNVAGGEAISFDVSCTPGQTIDIQKRCASTSNSAGTTGSISVSRTYTNAEKINEYLYNQII